MVKAEPEWQAEQLAAALHVLDSAGHTSDEERRAARVLRFLGSEAATQELARRFWSGNDQPFGWDLKFGLIGSPYRASAIQAMKAALINPEHPITQEFVNILTILEMQSDPKLRLPRYDDTHKEEGTKARDAYFSAFNKKMAAHMYELGANLQSKTGQARAVSVSELLQSDAPLDATTRTQLRQTLVASWNALPQRRQKELIEYRWDQIGGPEFQPILRTIVAGESDLSRSLDQLDRGSALRRIYELSPSEGRQDILQEMSSPHGDIGIDVLGLLPERELPQVELPLIAKLEAGNAGEIVFQIIERYASARILPDLKLIYERRGEWACVPQTAMLRYFLRVDPQYGIAQVRDALSLRHATACYKYQFTGLDEYVRNPKIEQMAITALDDPSIEVVRDAAQALSKYGSEKSEASLWARLEKFHQQWKGRYEQLHFRLGMKPEIVAEIGLEQVLVQAITNGQAWLATEDTVIRLKELASPQVQTQLDAVLEEIRRGEYGLHLNCWPKGALDYTLGRYSGKGMAGLKQKLMQLPPGTRLNLITTVAERERHHDEFAEVERAAAADGLVLQIQTPR